MIIESIGFHYPYDEAYRAEGKNEQVARVFRFGDIWSVYILPWSSAYYFLSREDCEQFLTQEGF